MSLHFHYIDIICALAVFLICAFSAYAGFLKRMSGAFSVVFSFITALFTYEPLAKYIKFTKNLNKYIIFIIIFLLSFVLFKFALHALSKKVSDKPIVGGLDRLFGFLLGLAEGLIALFIFAFLINWLLPELAKQSILIRYIHQNLFNEVNKWIY